MRNFVCLALCIMLLGCGEDKGQVAFERQARSEAMMREAQANRQKEREQARREHWQCAAYTSAVIAVILLVAGAAIGSKVRCQHDDTTDQA